MRLFDCSPYDCYCCCYCSCSLGCCCCCHCCGCCHACLCYWYCCCFARLMSNLIMRTNWLILIKATHTHTYTHHATLIHTHTQTHHATCHCIQLNRKAHSKFDSRSPSPQSTRSWLLHSQFPFALCIIRSPLATCHCHSHNLIASLTHSIIRYLETANYRRTPAIVFNFGFVFILLYKQFTLRDSCLEAGGNSIALSWGYSSLYLSLFYSLGLPVLLSLFLLDSFLFTLVTL